MPAEPLPYCTLPGRPLAPGAARSPVAGLCCCRSRLRHGTGWFPGKPAGTAHPAGEGRPDAPAAAHTGPPAPGLWWLLGARGHFAPTLARA